jgi:hypothetical protein
MIIKKAFSLWLSFGKMFWGQSLSSVYDNGIEEENRKITKGQFLYEGPYSDRINLAKDVKKVKSDFRSVLVKLENSASV